MKLQLTAIAAALALASSMAAMAASPVATQTNLHSVPWGVNNWNYPQDNNAWNDTAPPQNVFPTARDSLNTINSGSLSSANGINKEATTQTGPGNTASTVQTNANNESIINQTSQTGGHFADTDQSGRKNYSRVTQELGEGGVVNTLQTGKRNNSVVDQYGSVDNGADVFQQGDDNASYIRQGGPGGAADRNGAWVNQLGSNNESYIGQTHGDDNTAYVDQNGIDGTSFIIQRGSTNEAHLFQDITANNNESYILQDNRGYTFGGGHYASVTQSGGADNVATVTQLGQAQATAHSTVNQNGTGNQVSVLQY